MTPDKKLVFLAADTPRSNAYAQALSNARINVSAVALVSPQVQRWGQACSIVQNNAKPIDYFVPDLTLPLVDVCSSISQHVKIFRVSSINDPLIVTWLKDQAADLVVFSGFGGELVTRHVLEAGAPLLHMHAGWLPDYRGSTTIYYSLLRENNVGVSAIILTESIDKGPVLARKKYRVPPANMDIDYYYDSIVRADLLVTVLGDYIKTGCFVDVFDQSIYEGNTYYIIHPLLKHLVLNEIVRGAKSDCQ